MAKELTTLVIHEEKRQAEIVFNEQAFGGEDILPALSNFEDKYRTLNDDPRFDTVIIKANSNSIRINIEFDSLINDSLDVRTISKWEKIVSFFERLKKATVMTLQGEISGALLQLSLVCDHRICLPTTTFKFTEICSGFLPGMSVFRIAKYIGLGHAKQLLFNCKEITAEEALQLGFVDEITKNLEQAVQECAAYVKPENLEAIVLARRLLHESYHASYEEEVGDYLAAQARCFEHLKRFK